MSLNNCLLFHLASEIYKKFPSGWNKPDTPKSVQDTLNKIFDANLQLIEQLEKSLIIHGVSLSNKVFFNTVYLPVSIRNNHSNTSPTQISNFISLGAEVAGLNLSNSIIQSSLICGSQESALQSQGISLDSSELADVVFAYNNLNGISCRETIFRDVLLRNCSIEFGVFHNYVISNSLTICHDIDEDGKAYLSNCVFSCDSQQKQAKHEFILSDIVLKDCLFLGYFEPTHLYRVSFDSCEFGSDKQSKRCTILGKKPEKGQAINKWIFKDTSFVNCSVQNIYDSMVISNAPRIEYLEFIGCNMSELKIDVSSLENTATIMIENSTINDLELNAEVLKNNVPKPEIVLCKSKGTNGNKSNSVFSNPTLNGINITGDLSQLSVKINKKAQGSFKNCNISCYELHPEFVNCKGNFDLTGTHFTGKPDKHMKLVKVDFSKCIFNETMFFYCDLIECIFPELNKKSTITDKNKTKRARFNNCKLSNKKIDKADLSKIEICQNSSVKITTISNSSLAFSSIHTSLNNTTWQNCDFNEFHFAERVPGGKEEIFALDNCTFSSCTNLHLSNISVANSQFRTTKDYCKSNTAYSMSLSGKLLFLNSIFKNKSLITREASVCFEKDCVLTNTSFDNLSIDKKASTVVFEETTLSNCTFSFITFGERAFYYSIMRDNENGINTLENCWFWGNSKPFNRMSLQSLKIINPKFHKASELQFFESMINNQITIEHTETDTNNPDGRIKIPLQNCFDNFTNDDTRFFIKSSCKNNTILKIRLAGQYFCKRKFTPSDYSIEVDTQIDDIMTYEDWYVNYHLYTRFHGYTLKKMWHNGNGVLRYFGHDIKGSLGNPSTFPSFIEKHKLSIIKEIDIALDYVHLRFILSGETYNKLISSLKDLKNQVNSSSFDFRKIKKINDAILSTSRLETSNEKNISVNGGLLSKFSNEKHFFSQKSKNFDEGEKLYADFYMLENSVINSYSNEVQDHAKSKYHIGIFYEESYVSICLGDRGEGFPDKIKIDDFLREGKIPNNLIQFAQKWIKPSEEPEKCPGFTTIHRALRVFYIYRNNHWEKVKDNFLKENESFTLSGTYYSIPIPVLSGSTKED